MASESFTEFETLLESVDQLIEIHGKLQQGAGRRYEQDALHRAGVVLTIAAWQAYIEKVSDEAVRIMEGQFNNSEDVPLWASSYFVLRAASIRKAIKDLNTPNSQNVQRIFRDSFDFDPWPSWNWNAGPKSWTVSEVRKRTDEWLKIRHTISHGYNLPNDMEWIQSENAVPRLTLSLMQSCRRYFHKLARVTDDAFSRHLLERHGVDTNWA